MLTDGRCHGGRFRHKVVTIGIRRDPEGRAAELRGAVEVELQRCRSGSTQPELGPAVEDGCLVERRTGRHVEDDVDVRTRVERDRIDDRAIERTLQGGRGRGPRQQRQRVGNAGEENLRLCDVDLVPKVGEASGDPGELHLIRDIGGRNRNVAGEVIPIGVVAEVIRGAIDRDRVAAGKNRELGSAVKDRGGVQTLTVQIVKDDVDVVVRIKDSGVKRLPGDG